jgi:hypothetical protein
MQCQTYSEQGDNFIRCPRVAEYGRTRLGPDPQQIRMCSKCNQNLRVGNSIMAREEGVLQIFRNEDFRQEA